MCYLILEGGESCEDDYQKDQRQEIYFKQKENKKEGLKCFDPQRKELKRFEQCVTIFLKGENLENMIISVRTQKDQRQEIYLKKKESLKKMIQVFRSVEKKVKEI